MQIFVENFEQTLFTEDGLPQVIRIIAIRIIWITFATNITCAIASLIKWKEIGFSPLQACGHINIRKIYCKMDEHTIFKFKNRIISGAVELILYNGIRRVLPGKLALQLHGHDRDSIQKQNHINAVFIVQRVMQLPCAVHDICFILLYRRFIDRCFRFPKYGAEFDAAVGKPLTKDTQQANHFNLTAETVNHLFFAVHAVNLHIALPLLWLTGFYEGQEGSFVQRQPAVKSFRIAFCIAALGAKVGFNIFFKAFLFCIKIGHRLYLLFSGDYLVDEGPFVFGKFVDDNLTAFN